MYIELRAYHSLSNSSSIFAYTGKKKRERKPRGNAMITMRSRAEEPQVLHRSQGRKERWKKVPGKAEETVKLLRKKWQKWETKIINKGYIIDCRYICNDKVTMLPPNVTLKRRRSSSEPSGPRSYRFDRIKLHQVRVMSPVLLIHVSLRSTMQVLERIIQLCALR